MMKIPYQLLILCPALLTGCATVNTASNPVINYDPAKVQKIVDRTGPNQLFVSGVGDVSAGRQYIAASGRVCRTLRTLDGKLLPLRTCQSDSGEWYTTRSLSSSSVSRETSPPGSMSLIDLEL